MINFIISLYLPVHLSIDNFIIQLQTAYYMALLKRQGLQPWHHLRAIEFLRRMGIVTDTNDPIMVELKEAVETHQATQDKPPVWAKPYLVE